MRLGYWISGASYHTKSQKEFTSRLLNSENATVIETEGALKCALRRKEHER